MKDRIIQNGHRHFLCLCWICLVSAAGLSQQVIVNHAGEKVIMYPDGSWREPGPQDSLLLRDFMNNAAAKEKTNLSDKPKNIAQQQDALIKRAQEIKKTIQTEEKRVLNEFRAATNAQFKAAGLLETARKNADVIEASRMETLEEAYNVSIEQLRKAKLNQKAIQKLVSKGNSLSTNPDKLDIHSIEKLETRYQLYLRDFPNGSKPSQIQAIRKTDITASTEVPVNPAVDEMPTANTDTVHSADEKNALYQRQPYVCRPVLDSIDATTKRKHVSLGYENIFAHTDPDLRPFLKARELITCRGRLWKIGPYAYLDVDFLISSSHSKQNFGALEAGSLLRIKLMNDDLVSLYNLQSDRGHIDPYTGYTIFSGQYALGKEELKKLTSSEADKIRVLWLTGYEDYEVYQVDFFLNQIDCLLSR